MAAHLKLFFGDGDSAPPPRSPADLTADNTLIEFFYRYAWPDVLEPKGDKKATRKDYEKSLHYWKLFTADPPIARISKRTFSKYLRLLAGQTGQASEKLSPNTIHKHWGNIQRLLEWTGPQSRQNLNGAGLIEQSVYVEAPRKVWQPPKPAITLEEIWHWLQALPETAKPMPAVSQFDPIAWMRAVILVPYNTSMRPGMMFRVRWEMLDKHTLRAPASITKGEHGPLLWLNDAALEAIEPLRRSQGLIFGWENWPRAETTLKKHRERQQRAAGIPSYPLYALRRAFSTQCAKINPIAAQIMMNHQGVGMQMMINHYLDAEAILSDTLARMPQPRRIIQKMLFD